MTKQVTVYVDRQGKFIEGDTDEGTKITTEYRANWYLARAHIVISGPSDRSDSWQVTGYSGRSFQDEVVCFSVAQPASLDVVLAKAKKVWENYSTKKPFIYVELTLRR